MAKTIILDELHLAIRIPNDLPDDQTEAIRQRLTGDDFMKRLRRAIREVVRAFPELTLVHLSLTR